MPKIKFEFVVRISYECLERSVNNKVGILASKALDHGLRVVDWALEGLGDDTGVLHGTVNERPFLVG